MQFFILLFTYLSGWICLILHQQLLLGFLQLLLGFRQRGGGQETLQSEEEEPQQTAASQQVPQQAEKSGAQALVMQGPQDNMIQMC